MWGLNQPSIWNAPNKEAIMEYVIVQFRESRTVLIDDKASGPTNETLRVTEGFHTFSLAGPANFTPTEQTVEIKNTTQVSPQGVSFA